MLNPAEQIKDRIMNKGNSGYTELTSMMEMARTFGCLGEIIGREFDVVDKNGDLAFTVRQRPMAIKQAAIILKELQTLLRMDAEREAAKWGKKGGMKR